jgi:agmatinase
MSFPNYFADAESGFTNADFVIFGVPFDKTSTFRHGTNKAPKEIRNASWNFETYDLRTGIDLKDINFHDYGDLDVKNLGSKAMIKKVTDFTSNLINKNKFPIAIGGEHSISPGIVKAFSKDIAVLSLDAHLDFREEYENDVNNHACTLRRIADYIDIKNIATIGVRSSDKIEFNSAKKMELFYIDGFAIQKNGISQALKKTKSYLKGKKVYLTLDIDVIDPSFAPGTSTPEPFGINPFDVLECIDTFSPQLIGCDVVEVCPSYDNGETSLLAAKLIRYIIEAVSLKK